MAESMSSHERFPLFSRLPPELRCQIWRETLPERDAPALFRYHKGPWVLRRIAASHDGYGADDELVFSCDLLDVPVEVPLVFVNREARSLALAWVRKQRIQMRFSENRKCHVFVRPFDPMYDILYIAGHKLHSFIDEPWDRLDPNIPDHSASLDVNLRQMAVPEEVIWKDSDTLLGLFELFSCPEILFIVVDALPGLDNVDIDVHRRWEIKSAQGKAYIWNRDRKTFVLEDGEYLGREALYRQIGEFSKELGELLSNHCIHHSGHSVEIRPVFALQT